MVRTLPILVLLASGAVAPAGASEAASAASPPRAVACAEGRSEVPPPNPALRPAVTGAVDVSFHETDIGDVYRALGKAAGIDVLLDEQIREKKVSVDLKGLPFPQALERLLLVNQHYHQVIDEHTLIVIPDNQTKRRQYDQLAIRTFYLCWADINEMQQLIQRLINTRFMSTSKRLRSITIRDTVEKLTIAGRLIEAVDKPPGEVLLDIAVVRGRHETPIELRLSDGERGQVEIPDPEGEGPGHTISVAARVETLRPAEVSLGIIVALSKDAAEDSTKRVTVAKLEVASCLREGERALLGRIGDLSIHVTARLLRRPMVSQEDMAPLYIGTEETTVLRQP